MQIAFDYKQSSRFNDKLKGSSGSCSKNEKQGFIPSKTDFSGVKGTDKVLSSCRNLGSIVSKSLLAGGAGKGHVRLGTNTGGEPHHQRPASWQRAPPHWSPGADLRPLLDHRRSPGGPPEWGAGGQSRAEWPSRCLLEAAT